MTAPDALLREALEDLMADYGTSLPDEYVQRHIAKARTALAATPPASAERDAAPFLLCPVCRTDIVVRLAPAWNDGRPLPIVGCGNPWHYEGITVRAAEAR